MQFYKTQENAPGKFPGESTRLFPDRLTGGESSRRQLAGVFLSVLLLHIVLIVYLRRSPEPESRAQPLVMDVALIASPAPPQAKPAPPAPPVVQPKPQPAPVKPKKAQAIPKKKPVIQKPVSTPAPTPEPAPAAARPAAPISSPAQPKPVAAPATPPQPKTEPFTEANYRANYKSNPKPEYPRTAKSRGWQGKVLLRVQVTADGHSASVEVQQSSGHELLDAAAIEAVKNWTFIPAKRGDTPVASMVTVPIQFKLNE